MREIMFRGKTSSEVLGGNCKKDGTWVYGFYRDRLGCPTISEFDFSYGNYIDYEIDRNTLCQYIGLTDINDIKIFEGDFIKAKHNTNLYNVYWNEGRFYIEDIWGNLIKPTQTAINHFECEVVGNIYDNPELIGDNNG